MSRFPLPGESIKPPRVLVVGDAMLDQYTWGSTSRVSPEAPVLILEAERDEWRLGGAASVAYLLRALDARVALAGVVGQDENGQQVRHLLREAGIDCSLVVEDSLRQSTLKHRLIGRAGGAHTHQILRVDRETCTPLAGPLVRELVQGMLRELPDVDAVIVSDYGKGVCTGDLLQPLIEACGNRAIPVIVDPARNADPANYHSATVLTPNRIEAERLTGASIQDIPDAFAAGSQLCRNCSVSAVAVTLDRDGIAIIEESGATRHFPTRPRDLYDITGAGDMVAAIFAVVLGGGGTVSAAAELANIAAGLQVERFGVTPVTWSEIEQDRRTTPMAPCETSVCTALDIERIAVRARREGLRVVLTNGCFDLLHAGHLAMLREARRLGDLLIVAVNSDRSVRRLKGTDRPIVGQQARAALLSQLDCVDYVVVFDEDTPHELLATIRPDVLVKGGTTTRVVGREIVEGYGGQVVTTPAVPGVSTTQILNATAAPPIYAEGLMCD